MIFNFFNKIKTQGRVVDNVEAVHEGPSLRQTALLHPTFGPEVCMN
jgi:hypothetical protein